MRPPENCVRCGAKLCGFKKCQECGSVGGKPRPAAIVCPKCNHRYFPLAGRYDRIRTCPACSCKFRVLHYESIMQESVEGIGLNHWACENCRHIWLDKSEDPKECPKCLTARGLISVPIRECIRCVECGTAIIGRGEPPQECPQCTALGWAQLK